MARHRHRPRGGARARTSPATTPPGRASTAARVTVATHVCRGNARSAWHSEGSYEAIAEQVFSELQVDRFLLEYDTERAGGFEPLRFVPKGKIVVLGLVTTKEARWSPRTRSCGASTRRRSTCPSRTWRSARSAASPRSRLGNLLTWDDQRRKLELVAETARKVWG